MPSDLDARLDAVRMNARLFNDLPEDEQRVFVIGAASRFTLSWAQCRELRRIRREDWADPMYDTYGPCYRSFP